MSNEAVPGDTIIITDEGSDHYGHECVVVECPQEERKYRHSWSQTWFFSRVHGKEVWASLEQYLILRRGVQNGQES